MPDNDASTKARNALRKQQSAFVDALVRGGAVPDAFSSDHITRAADALLHKRRRMLEKTWPRLATELADQFPSLFATFALTHPLSSDGADDGQRFAEWLLLQQRLPTAVAPVLLASQLRRGWPIKFRKLGHAWCFGARWPAVGVRVFAINTSKSSDAKADAES